MVEWWGGGEYKAVGKDAKHRTVAWFPSATGEWLTLDGDSKPFVLRNRKGGATPAPAAAQPSAPALAPQDALLGMKTQVLHELRNIRVAAAPPPPASDGPLVARIQAQAAQATAASQVHAAEATATRQANTQIMQTLLSVVAERPVESATRPAESTTLALQLISAMKKLVPTPAVAPCLAEQIPVIKALSDLDQSAAVAPAIELQPVVDIFDQVMTADAARTQPERVQTATEPQEAPTPHRPPRPRPVLVHVPGLGMVEVVAPDADALLFDDMSIEQRAAAIRKDPALVCELGIAPPPIAPVAVAQASPAAPASLVSSPVVEPVVVLPVVPDLEPTPVLVVAAAPSLSSATVPAAPSVVAATLPELATIVPTSPATPSMVTAAREERPAIALPERMPDPEPLHAAAPDHQRAVDEPKRRTLLTHEERVGALRKLRGIGATYDDDARAMVSLPADAVMAIAQTLDLDPLRFDRRAGRRGERRRRRVNEGNLRRSQSSVRGPARALRQRSVAVVPRRPPAVHGGRPLHSTLASPCRPPERALVGASATILRCRQPHHSAATLRSPQPRDPWGGRFYRRSRGGD